MSRTICHGTGPRRSGKTALRRATFPDLDYVGLEAPDLRKFAESDPSSFLARFGQRAVLDEIQRVPDLLSNLQDLADEAGRNSFFVLTGSEQFRLSDAIGQSLAGRTALLRLLPFSLAERVLTGASNSIDDILYSGFYPRIRDLANFRRFVRLCAGRVGQLANLSSLGADAGVSHAAASHWLTVLEASSVVFRLPPFRTNTVNG
ncbi:MAG: ATP-binding protein [Albidovulum sp.]|nr:ATP-binding protein [Albidovulum sp.]MDE0529959.1 ATP-binding protein [Albidovulum sp.]